MGAYTFVFTITILINLIISVSVQDSKEQRHWIVKFILIFVESQPYSQTTLKNPQLSTASINQSTNGIRQTVCVQFSSIKDFQQHLCGYVPRSASTTYCPSSRSRSLSAAYYFQDTNHQRLVHHTRSVH